VKNFIRIFIRSLVFTLAGMIGCTASLTGGGTVRLGVSNANYLEISHTVDGDKAGKTSEAELEINKTILDAVLPSRSSEPSADDPGNIPGDLDTDGNPDPSGLPTP
jgi:hypothetical protein